MTIHLRRDLEAMLRAQVDLGKYPSIEAALEAAVLAFADAQAETLSENDDLSWAKPLLEEADRDFEAGRIVTTDELRATIAKRFGQGKR